jgi:phosphate-selective porin OprO/OprP
MTLPYVIRTVLLLGILFSAIPLKAQQNDELLNLLIKKNVLSQKDADSLRTELALKEQAKRDKDKENQRGITIGSRALQISGLIQTEYQGFEQTGMNNAFSLHRSRLDVKGNINDNWNYEVYTEFAGTTKLLDAYTGYKLQIT